MPNFLELYPTDGWDLMIRHPLKKKIMGDRFWKLCFVRIEGNLILIFNNRKETKPYYEILIQVFYFKFNYKFFKLFRLLMYYLIWFFSHMTLTEKFTLQNYNKFFIKNDLESEQVNFLLFFK